MRRLAMMTIPVALFGTITLSGCAGSHASADPTQAAVAAPVPAAAIDALVAATFPKADDPGAAVRVLRGGQVVYDRAVGRASLESGETIGPNTNFRLASVTKQFTATAILLLRQDGKLSLDDPLVKFFPDFPEYGRQITVEQLLTHTSGLIDYEDVMPPDLKEPILDAGVVELMKAQTKTYFPPGAKFQYSNSGYAVLAIIIEKVSGKSYATFLHERIFAPLGMAETVAFENGKSTVSHRAFGYKLVDGKWTFADQNLTSSVLGDGGIYSNLDDFSKWSRALDAGTLLPKSVIAESMTPKKASNGTEIPYGYGWRLEDADGRHVIFHTGSSTGFNNIVRRVPDKDLVVIVFANRTGTEAKELAPKIEKLVLDGAAK